MYIDGHGRRVYSSVDEGRQYCDAVESTGQQEETMSDQPVWTDAEYAAVLGMAEAAQKERDALRKAILRAVQFLAADDGSSKIDWSGDVGALLMSYVVGHDNDREQAMERAEKAEAELAAIKGRGDGQVRSLLKKACDWLDECHAGEPHGRAEKDAFVAEIREALARGGEGEG